MTPWCQTLFMEIGVVCSAAVTAHLWRGLAALALIVASYMLGSAHRVWSVIVLAGAFVMLRGCPMCWLIGLFHMRKHAQSTVSLPVKNHQ